MRIFDSSRTGGVPKLRIINLVDILFILLLFFVVTTTFRIDSPNAVKVALPEAKTGEEHGKERPSHVIISVDAKGSIFFNSTAVELDSLEEKLRIEKEKSPDLVLEFSADKNATYGIVVAIVDAARAVGIHNVTAFTKKSVK